MGNGCWGFQESTLERVVMLDPVGHDTLLAGCMRACKLMVGADPGGVDGDRKPMPKIMWI